MEELAKIVHFGGTSLEMEGLEGGYGPNKFDELIVVPFEACET